MNSIAKKIGVPISMSSVAVEEMVASIHVVSKRAVGTVEIQKSLKNGTHLTEQNNNGVSEITNGIHEISVALADLSELSNKNQRILEHLIVLQDDLQHRD